MNKLQAIAVTAVVLVGGAGAAHADTYVENATSVRKIYGGYTSTTAKITGHKVTKQWTDSISAKAEADKGDFNTANVNLSFDGGFKVKANAHSSNQRPVDPVAIVTATSQKEYSYEVENYDINQYSRNYFSGTDFTHSVSSGSK